jgi:RNA polymerase sporulation-specific sigma factor
MPISKQCKQQALNDLAVEYQRTGSEATFEKILSRMAYVVRYWAKRYYILGSEQEDLEQLARMALLGACRNYNPLLGGFQCFASIAIKRRLCTEIKARCNSKDPLLRALSINAPSFLKGDEEEYEVFDEMTAPEAYAMDEDMVARKAALRECLTPMENAVFTMYLAHYSYADMAVAMRRVAKGRTEKQIEKLIDNCLCRVRKKARSCKERP